MPVPPASVTSSAVSSIVSGRLYSDGCSRVVRPVQYTVAPAAPSSTAMPRPAPRVAPATSATRPRRSTSALGGVGPAPEVRGRRDAAVVARPGLARRERFLDPVERTEGAAEVVDHVHEGRLARAGDDRRP